MSDFPDDTARLQAAVAAIDDDVRRLRELHKRVEAGRFIFRHVWRARVVVLPHSV